MRKSLFLALAGLLFAVPFVQKPAMAYSLVGTWRGSVYLNGGIMYSSLVLEANGQFNELDRSGSLMTEQSGGWQIIRGLLHLEVWDWQPKYQCLQTGCFPVREPPGSWYRIQWLSPNMARFQDVTFGGSIVYRRY